MQMLEASSGCLEVQEASRVYLEILQEDLETSSEYLRVSRVAGGKQCVSRGAGGKQ